MNKSNLLRFNHRETKTKSTKQKGKVYAFPAKQKQQPEMVTLYVLVNEHLIPFSEIPYTAINELGAFTRKVCATYAITGGKTHG